MLLRPFDIDLKNALNVQTDENSPKFIYSYLKERKKLKSILYLVWKEILSGVPQEPVSVMPNTF